MKAILTIIICKVLFLLILGAPSALRAEDISLADTLPSSVYHFEAPARNSLTLYNGILPPIFLGVFGLLFLFGLFRFWWGSRENGNVSAD